MKFINYFFAHFLFALIIFLIGYWAAKKYPSLFGNLPLVGSG